MAGRRNGGRPVAEPNGRRRVFRSPSSQDHGDSRGHGAEHHAHGTSTDADWRWLSTALALILAFMAAEITAGVAAHSLALISDAAHMLTDAVSLGLVLVTMRLTARPPGGGYTYGLKRAEILSAQANGLTLVLLGGGLGYEAILRLMSPPPAAGGLMLGVALAGVAVNLAATSLIGRANRRSLNVEGAFRHILTDLYAFIATAAAGLVILLSGAARADAAASLIVVGLMLKAGAGLIRESGRIFLEAAPPGLSPSAIGEAMAARPYVTEVHDLHIWQITPELPAASAHVLVEPGHDCHAVRADLEAYLRSDHGITHTTLQVDHAPDRLLIVSRRPPPPGEAGQPTGERSADRHRAIRPDASEPGAGEPGPGRPGPGPHCEDPHGPVHRHGSGDTG
jgi:cobalt-zinc-cadmium efflux system protein